MVGDSFLSERARHIWRHLHGVTRFRVGSRFVLLFEDHLGGYIFLYGLAGWQKHYPLRVSCTKRGAAVCLGNLYTWCIIIIGHFLSLSERADTSYACSCTKHCRRHPFSTILEGRLVVLLGVVEICVTDMRSLLA